MYSSNNTQFNGLGSPEAYEQMAGKVLSELQAQFEAKESKGPFKKITSTKESFMADKQKAMSLVGRWLNKKSRQSSLNSASQKRATLSKEARQLQTESISNAWKTLRKNSTTQNI